ncbi:s-adenosylmethionine (SAM)-dependent methyltransferase [Nannizzia gypsea CBS 118893]|uniref:S-adenosylmethionine (SAM)-dependent methyltransferase n=1 Tax=Arthroderma gypseum (strain ATCC MYA-4604 / CBS 118893) TaxID=535722 RepID=E4UVX4_ARTGP|nr:s-adenosylmethionine (SAM)-dependent methyltransferase [Nannizzia gypsea CBS 118893]EFR01635.1 s-adenosylmethionine (SAM)-dependent methyltransferase [Nannizzia gypsea CBS 118893]
MALRESDRDTWSAEVRLPYQCIYRWFCIGSWLTVTQAYSAAASFVPQLTEKVLQLLQPRAEDKVLDVGCGDGQFTAKFVSAVGAVLGVDSSPAMVDAARTLLGPSTAAATARAAFRVVDCRHLGQTDIVDGSWDKVVSNAALHWILRDASTRIAVLQAIFDCLKPGGAFVFEMGGHGNVAEVHAALLAALVRHGLPLQQARDASPWFFPSDAWMRETLEGIGFVVDTLEVEHRPTKLTLDPDTSSGTSGNTGIEGWVRLMGASMIETLPPDVRDEAVRSTCDLLHPVISREDGSSWLGYVRLRGVARRPTPTT